MLTDEGIKSRLDGSAAGVTELPLRMELFSVEQRKERGRALAQEHHLGKYGKQDGRRLLRRLRSNEEILRAINRKLIDDVNGKLPLTSVGEWLVDNFYVIEEQINLALRHLPKKYLLQLPRLGNPDRAGTPRVYDVAEHIVAYGDSRVEMQDLTVIVTAYEEITPLNLGELWALPIMLRLALIENVRRIAILADKCRDEMERARRWAERLIETDERDPKNLVLTMADMARAQPTLTSPFVAEFKRRLQSRGSAMKLPLQWIEQNLGEQGRSMEQTIAEENHIQAVLEMSMRNCVNSLRGLNVTDWNEFVETMSRVERILRRDPGDVYGKMDFSTRDDYRRVVERLARGSGQDEAAVASSCLELARDAASAKGGRDPSAHVGYYLIGDGEKNLRRQVGYRGGVAEWLRDASTRFVLFLYFGAIVLLTVLFTAITAAVAHAGGVRGDMLLALGILLAFATCHLAVGLVNVLASKLVRPRSLPRLNFVKGIPAEMRTMVVVPVIISSEKSVSDMLRGLEMHYLNNRGTNIHFALLTDLPDAPHEVMPEDEPLLNLCRLGIIKLNDKYPEDGGDNFLLFHRPRKWNETERVWMAWERKRGKLEDLNRYLLGEDLDAFSCIEGRTDTLSNVRYVITLDADTAMGREAAWQMVGAMAHPLIRPVYDEKLGRVVAGHGILQPRVESSLVGANRTHYSRMCASEIGIDPYTRASSDIYQDLFDEGSFIGKGIYDVGMFNRALGRRFPDNKILSHDLLEGCVMRSGLLNDVKLYEDPPRSYLMDMYRRHRWVRGDWQIINYLLGIEVREGKRETTRPLNALSQWKIFDNLRRSLTPVVLFLLLVLGLTVFADPLLYVAVVAGVFVVPVAASVMISLASKSPDKTIRQHVKNCWGVALREAVEVLFKLACMPFEAHVCVDAIVRSLWRQCVSHRLLLQWNPSDNSYNERLAKFWPIFRRMWIGPLSAFFMVGVLLRKNPGLIPYAAPLMLLWLLSPLFAGWLSKRRKPRSEVLSDRSRALFRLAARRTWHFFEDFVHAGENWLPPDNYQEYPLGVVAHRTSPTNMGLSLLANLAAMDLGYIPSGRLLERTEKTLETMSRLERFQGHFYNWYDTRSLDVLRPGYVSTVDSGNLAAHLLVLASGLRDAAAAPVLSARIFAGLRDALDLAVDEADNRTGPILMGLESLRRSTAEAEASPPVTLPQFRAALSGLAGGARSVLERWDGQTEERARKWIEAYAGQCRDALAELEELVPWADNAAVADGKWPALADMPSLLDVAYLDGRLETDGGAGGSLGDVPEDVRALVGKGAENARHRLSAFQKLLVECEELSNIDFDFLYDKSKRLLAIGFNVDDRRRDNSYYDLLASEARLATYLGVAQHKIPQSSWFALGRLLTLAEGHPLLVSWSGSMFEYLMPLLVMPTYEDTLLDETYRACVHAQVEYSRDMGTPWGVSESGYNIFDADQNYQYRAFGVPELGLKHSLSDDLVIAPYATALAAMVYPEQAARNFERMAEMGFQTSYGFYEAVDFTPTRLPTGGEQAVIRSFMAHHQGMSLVALDQVLADRPMHRRFNANPMLRSASLLLQEMVPAERAMYYHSTYSPELRQQSPTAEEPSRIVTNPGSSQPEVQLLSNGNYHVMVTAAGGGYSRWREYSLTRWREDPTADNWGTFCYLRDRESGEVWSNTHQPMRAAARNYRAIFSEGRAEFSRRDGDFDCHTEIVVSPEDDVEVRRIRITNLSTRRREIDVTSYAEVALAKQAADDSHQAFSKLFIQTRIVPDRQAIVCSRRPANAQEKTPLMFHMLAVRGTDGGAVSYESDRLAFLGRGCDASAPGVLRGRSGGLAGGMGAVLDPIVSIRSGLTLEPGEKATVDIVTGVGEDEEAVSRLLEKYQDQRTADKTFDMAWTHGQLLLRQVNVTDAEARRFCQLAGSVVYANPALRAGPELIARNNKGQSALWGYAVSGDLPLVLLKVTDSSRLFLVSQMLQAHSYWRQKGLKVDLMIWNEDETSYRASLHDQIMSLAGASIDDANMEQPGGIFVRGVDRIAEEDKVLLQAVARIVMSDSDGLLEEQMRRLAKSEQSSPSTVLQYRRSPRRLTNGHPIPVEDLALANEYGGFAKDGREYVVVTDDEVKTPLPWVNVLANEKFGCVVSESGATYTWSENAHEFRITPWHNDPVSDPTGEALYIRDERTGEFWSPMPGPCRSGGQYVVRHGFGYSSFEHDAGGIRTKLTIHVDKEDSVKFFTLKLTNTTNERRSLSATAYVEWVLGDLRTKTAMHVATGVDQRSGALFARNQYNDEFRGRIAFLDVDDPARTVLGDRREFLGRNGSVADPLGMRRPSLAGRVGAGLDPCGATQVKFNLGPGQERRVVFRLGIGENVDEARKLVMRHRGGDAARASFDGTVKFWKELLETVQVETPDQAFNFMANGWLLYQALACRFWGRSATYQSGGAFGFRDQLQDSMALVYARPDLVRRHLLTCAARQFPEGDVQHWWHPPAGRGVRTLCSDDYLWLPVVAERYVAVTGDAGVLDEPCAFIQGRLLREGEESYYDLPQPSDQKDSLYEHCKRSLRHGMRFGYHGLPLIGSGDWNDGMDHVGREGKGESVWLGFFLHSALTRFAEVARSRGDDGFVAECETRAADLADSLEKNAWDDAWYRRAYFDDGTPLGSALNDECRIDSIAQSWSVLSGVGSPERCGKAMQALDEHLVDREHLLIKLFEPPFDSGALNPGYIKGYVPGVRENGGQYTHGAIWAGMAFAKLRDHGKTWEMQRILNPANHALTREWADRYKVEPYVVSADIYANPQHLGRGGWSWYTGSASWLYRFMLESILGFNLNPDAIKVDPCVPADWQSYKIRFRRKHLVYDINVTKAPAGAAAPTMVIDGVGGSETRIRIAEDAKEHKVEMRIKD